MGDFASIRKKVSDSAVKAQLISDDVKALTNDLEALKASQIDLEALQVYVQTIAKEMQEELRFSLEGIVNTALDAIFPGRYQFKIELRVARNKTELVLGLSSSEFPDISMDPVSSNGGGLTDVLAFSLRIAVLLISKRRRILLLDEAMKFVSSDLKPEAFQILKRLSKDFGIQVIAVTHDQEMVNIADRVFKFAKHHNETKVVGEVRK